MPASAPSVVENEEPRPLREIAASGQLRREELADFLRMRRAALQPEDVGLPAGEFPRFAECRVAGRPPLSGATAPRHIGGPEFESLILALRRSSPEFARAWERHEVSHSGEGRKDLRHPLAGMMSFNHAVFH